MESVKSNLGAIRQRLTPQNGRYFNPDLTSPDAFSAMHDFRRAIIDWAMKNPNADAMETEKAVEDITGVIISRIKSSGDILRGNIYERPADAGATPFAQP